MQSSELSDIPAWVQAIGSILAIAVAIWIGERQHKRTVKLVQDQRDYERAEEQRRLLNSAIWIGSALQDAMVRSEQRAVLIGAMEIQPGLLKMHAHEGEQVKKLIAAFRGDWGLLTPQSMQAVSEFEPRVAELIVSAIRAVSVYESGLQATANFAVSGHVTSDAVSKGMKTAIRRAKIIEERSRKAYEALAVEFGIVSVEDAGLYAKAGKDKAATPS